MSTCLNPAALYGSPLSSKVALFNDFAKNHIEGQAVNPFSNDQKSGNLLKPTFSREDYGRPARGSLSEARGFRATQQVSKEIVELCDIISSQGEPLYSREEKPDDPRMVISFGELFSIYTVISDKLVGMLLRARKYKLVDFEGECLFQRRDDHVPVILLKSLAEVRDLLRDKLTPSPSPTPERMCEEECHSDGGNSKSMEEVRDLLHDKFTTSPSSTPERISEEECHSDGGNSD